MSPGDNYSSIAASVQEKVRLLSEVPAGISFYIDPEFPHDEDTLAKVRKNDAAKDLLEKLADAFEHLESWDSAKETIGQTAKDNGAKPGQLMFPTRFALSGQSGGPDLGDILTILGKDECVRRIRRAVCIL